MIGIKYDTKTRRYGILEYYPLTICAHSLEKLHSELSEYQKGSNVTVWYFPETLPVTYLTRPEVKNWLAEIFMWIGIVMMLQILLAIPFFVFVKKSSGQKDSDRN